jgi:prepilin-type N-terminal cleavage/methylation domain-containing protein
MLESYIHQASKMFSSAQAVRFLHSPKGFTLIELLIVVAIIGILAGIIVVRMSTASNAAKDANVKSYMNQIKSRAALQYNNNTSSNYTGLTTLSDYTVLRGKLNGQAAAASVFTSSTDNKKYCMYARLNVPTTATYWCIDSSGNSRTITSVSRCGNAATTTCQ